MALSCGPASTVSYANHVRPVPLSAPTARASPYHGDQSQTHSFPDNFMLMKNTAKESDIQRSPRSTGRSCALMSYRL